MKKLIIGSLILFFAWQYYEKNYSDRLPERVTYTPLTDAPAPTISNEPRLGSYQCDGRKYCNQMSSRQEAEYFFKNCPDTKMDPDNDGIPCEKDVRF